MAATRGQKIVNSPFDKLGLFDQLPIDPKNHEPSLKAVRRKPGQRRDQKQLKMFKTDSDVRDGYSLDLEPLDATFRDSNRAPLHSWFPYLEGYSPRFVERVRHEYLGDAKRIIEPFAGSGTTPIVLGQSGIECAFAEANPAMAFIAETKLAVLRLNDKVRAKLVDDLVTLADTLKKRVPATVADENLLAAYSNTFGSSKFFDELALDEVVRLRTLNDELLSLNPLVGNCFSVAVLSSLIPTSRLKRAGDLRYRTPKELTAGLPFPVDLVSNRLTTQAADLSHSAILTADARFVCATAGTMHEHLDDGWHGVITSPPYLNGTNYIRNARMELWYLRHLQENADLRRLRDKVITSGINDVHSQTRWNPVTSGVESVMREIEQNAYDSRISKMVGGYFNDMAVAFRSLQECLSPGGRLCVDIGDSIYNKVHVRTDDLLVEVAESVGFRTLDRVHLRNRISKGGAKVSQQLLVFERINNVAT